MASATLIERPRYVKGFFVQQRVRLTAVAFSLVLISEILLGCKPPHALQFENPWVAIGTMALLLGLLIRSWAAGMLVKKKRLACDGPYALVRHPLYLGSILLMLGFAMLTGLWWNLPVAGLIALVSFGSAINSEERFLAAKFGDRWTDYAADRGRLLPHRVAGNVIAFWNWKRWLRNREFNAWLGALIGWLGLLAWHAAAR